MKDDIWYVVRSNNTEDSICFRDGTVLLCGWVEALKDFERTKRFRQAQERNESSARLL